MIAEMDPLNARLAKEAEAEGRKHIPLKVGLGINTVNSRLSHNRKEQFAVAHPFNRLDC